MSITIKSLLSKADSLAEDYNMAVNGTDRVKIKADWYKECARVADIIRTHRSFSEKKIERRKKLKKAPSSPSK